METFSALLAICVENEPVPGEFLAQRPVTRSFDVFSDLGLNKRLREAGDLRRYRVHYDVTVMILLPIDMNMIKLLKIHWTRLSLLP